MRNKLHIEHFHVIAFIILFAFLFISLSLFDGKQTSLKKIITGSTKAYRGIKALNYFFSYF